jgi:uncharacterized radical SAM superfamily protein
MVPIEFNEDGDIPLEHMFEQFKSFLHSCGYELNGTIGIVENKSSSINNKHRTDGYPPIYMDYADSYDKTFW